MPPRFLIPFRRSRRALIVALAAAVVVVAVGAGLIAGLGSPVGSPSPSGRGSTAFDARTPPAPSVSPTSERPAGPYRWTLLSSEGDLATAFVGQVIRRRDGSFLAIAYKDGPRMVTSPDGRIWTIQPADPGLQHAPAERFSVVAGIAEGPGAFVAVGATAIADSSSGDAQAWTSPDGLHWQVTASSAGMADAEMESVTAGPAGFVAVGSDGFPGANTQLPGARGAAVWLSSDGSAWSRVPSQPSFAGGVMFGVRQTSSGFVTWGEAHGSPDPPIWTSADGLLWDRASGFDAGGTLDPFASIIPVGDHLVAVGARRLPDDAGGAAVPAVWSSSDGGNSWTLAAVPDGLGASARSGGLWDVALDGSNLLSVGRLDAGLGETGLGPVILWRSTDQGATWTALPDEPIFEGSIIERVVSIDGGFAAFGGTADINANANANQIWVGERIAP